MIHPYYKDSLDLLQQINRFRWLRLSKTVSKRFAKNILLSEYPDIRAIQKKFRRSIIMWVYFDRPIDYYKMIERTLAICDKAEAEARSYRESAPKN